MAKLKQEKPVKYTFNLQNTKCNVIGNILVSNNINVTYSKGRN